MAFKNEVYLSGKVAGEVKQFGNGPHRFQIQQGGGPKKNKPGEYWPKEYFDVIVWPRETELVEIVRKIAHRQEIEIEGRLTAETWDDKQTGARRHRTVIVANHLGVSQEATAGADRKPLAQANNDVERSTFITDDDIPF